MKNLFIGLIAIFPLMLSAQSFEKAMEYLENNQDSLALAEFVMCEPVYKEKYGELDTVYYTKIMLNIGHISARSYYLFKAEKYYRTVLECFDFYKCVNSDYLSAITNLVGVYSNMGYYDIAETYFYKGVNACKNTEEINADWYYLNLLNYAGSVYFSRQKYLESLNTFKQIINECDKNESKDSFLISGVHCNIAIIYSDLGYYDKSVECFNNALSSNSRSSTLDTLYLLNTLNSMGCLYQDTDEIDLSHKYFDFGIEIAKTNPDYFFRAGIYPMLLYNKANSYYMDDEYTESLKLLQELILALDSTRAKYLFHTYHEVYSLRGHIFFELVEYKKALEEIEKMLALNKMKDLSYTEYSGILLIKGIILWNKGMYSECETVFLDILNKVMMHINKSNNSFLTRKFDKNLNELLPGLFYLSEFASASESSVEYKVMNYEFINLLKENSLKKITANQKQLKFIQKHKKVLKRRLYNYYSDNSSMQVHEKDSLERILFEYEEGFAISTETKTDCIDFGFPKRNSLNEEDVLIQIFTYKVYEKHKMTDVIQYAAYVVRPEYEYPHLVKLCTNFELEAYITKTQKQTTENSPIGHPSIDEYISNLYANNDTSLYSLIWEPLDSLLQGVEKVFISPEGELYNIAFDALPISSSQRLCDRYEIEYVSSSAQVVMKPEPLFFSDTSSVALFGDMNYDMDTTAIKDQTLAYATSRGEENVNMERGGTWLPLNNAEEISGINTIFSKNNTSTVAYTKNQAIEEAFLNLDGHAPQIIHLSTHAKYNALTEKQDEISDSIWYETSENPLLRSFLAMSGANTLDTIRSTEIADGKLTAYEVANMDLSNTRLASLAACQTGLGDIGTYEGVQGLRHAFKIAGVDYLLLSLWSVPDKQTGELMLAFYTNFVDKKMEVRDAFRNAQQQMKEKYDSPYFWAGFVLVN